MPQDTVHGFRTMDQTFATMASVTLDLAIKPYTHWTLRVLMFTCAGNTTVFKNEPEILDLTNFSGGPANNGSYWLKSKVQTFQENQIEPPFVPWHNLNPAPGITTQEIVRTGFPNARQFALLRDVRLDIRNRSSSMKRKHININKKLRHILRYEAIKFDFDFVNRPSEAYRPINVLLIAHPNVGDGEMPIRIEHPPTINEFADHQAFSDYQEVIRNRGDTKDPEPDVPISKRKTFGEELRARQRVASTTDDAWDEYAQVQADPIGDWDQLERRYGDPSVPDYRGHSEQPVSDHQAYDVGNPAEHNEEELDEEEITTHQAFIENPVERYSHFGFDVQVTTRLWFTESRRTFARQIS